MKPKTKIDELISVISDVNNPFVGDLAKEVAISILREWENQSCPIHATFSRANGYDEQELHDIATGIGALIHEQYLSYNLTDRMRRMGFQNTLKACYGSHDKDGNFVRDDAKSQCRYTIFIGRKDEPTESKDVSIHRDELKTVGEAVFA